MAEYAHGRMPNFVQRISGEKDFAAFERKAQEYALPKILFFSKKSKTSPTMKALSTTYRRRALVGEIRGSKNNAGLISKFGVESFPTVLFLPDEGAAIPMKKKPTWNRLNTFLHEHALRKPYFEDEIAQRILESRKEEL